jgi:hypothetical protein
MSGRLTGRSGTPPAYQDTGPCSSVNVPVGPSGARADLRTMLSDPSAVIGLQAFDEHPSVSGAPS